MKGTILLNYNENTKQVEEEEKLRFLRSILEQMGLPINEFWIGDSLSVTQKMQLRNILQTFNITVLDDLDGHLQIYVDDTLAGEWNKPLYKLKRDLRELNPRKQLYLEMNIDYYSIFDETSDE